MLLNLTKKIDKLCKYIENIVKYDQFGLYNMFGSQMNMPSQIKRMHWGEISTFNNQSPLRRDIMVGRVRQRCSLLRFQPGGILNAFKEGGVIIR